VRHPTRLYLLGMGAWATAHFGVADDRIAPLYLSNAVAPLLFVPALGVAVVAVVRGARALGLACFAVGLLACWLFVGWFIPQPTAPQLRAPSLIAMTYNLAAGSPDPAPIIAAIRASDADLVGLFELQPDMSRAIEAALGTEYPFQALLPDPGAHGIGALSRFPLEPVPETLPGTWSGRPQQFGVRWRDRTVRWVNVQAHSPGVVLSALQDGHSVSHTWQWLAARRQEETEALRRLASRHADPIVITTDLNVTPYNRAYATVAEKLTDTWRAAGWGFGHTWSPFPRRLGYPFWIARIDYVWCSADWHVQRATVGTWDGSSDHRPVLATLALRAEGRSPR
jgi:vancomycin resistance protein VanJ